VAHYLHRPGPLLHDVGFDWLPVVIATCLSLLWFVFCLFFFFFGDLWHRPWLDALIDFCARGRWFCC